MDLSGAWPYSLHVAPRRSWGQAVRLEAEICSHSKLPSSLCLTSLLYLSLGGDTSCFSRRPPPSIRLTESVFRVQN